MKKFRVSYATVSRAVKLAEKRGVKMSNVRSSLEVFLEKVDRC